MPSSWENTDANWSTYSEIFGAFYDLRNSPFITATLETALLEAYRTSRSWSMRTRSSTISITTRIATSPKAQIMIAKAFSRFPRVRDEVWRALETEFCVTIAVHDSSKLASTTFQTPLIWQAAHRRCRQRVQSCPCFACQHGLFTEEVGSDSTSESNVVSKELYHQISMWYGTKMKQRECVDAYRKDQKPSEGLHQSTAVNGKLVSNKEKVTGDENTRHSIARTPAETMYQSLNARPKSSGSRITDKLQVLYTWRILISNSKAHSEMN